MAAFMDMHVSKPQMALFAALHKAGGYTAMAKALGVSRQAIYNWRDNDEIPVKRALEIERLTGIPAADLNPDFFRK